MNLKGKFKKGIRIRTYNIILLLLTTVISLLLLCSMFQMNKQFQLFRNSEQAYQTGLNNANTLKDASDNLTSQVQHFVSTSDLVYLNNYFDEVNSGRREMAVQSFEELNPSGSDNSWMDMAKDESDALMELEYHAMKLVLNANQVPDSEIPEELLTYTLTQSELALSYEEQMLQAVSLVFDETYQDSKDAINYDIEQFTSTILEKLYTENQFYSNKAQSIIRHVIFYVILTIAVTIGMCVIWHTQVIAILERYIRCIIANKPLESRGAYEFRYLAESYNKVSKRIKQENMRLHHYAEHDSLTGLLNRSMLQSEVEKALDPTQSSSVCGAFLLVDVDHFKNINDSYGHDFGDHMLQHIADLLRTTFALDNLVARFGGDEFAVWIQNIDKGQASFILTRINEINQQLKYPEKFYPEESYPENSISVGVAFAQSGDSFTSLYKKADEVLYQVKDNGRCGVKIYSET